MTAVKYWILDDFRRLILIVLLKKPGVNEYNITQTSSLMSRLTKPIILILMNTACSKIKAKIVQEQWIFLQDTGTRNATFVITMLSHQAIEMQKDPYLCFIDYTKAFSNIWLLEILGELALQRKIIQIICTGNK